MFKITHKSNNARVGIISNGNHIAETPFYMPVATKAVPKYMTIEDLKRMNTQAFISNAFLMHLTAGDDLIGKHGGIHSFMNFNGIIFADSGGFQMLSDYFYQKTTSEGIYLKNPVDGKNVLMTPEKVVEINKNLKTDVMMVLDHVPKSSATKDEIIESLKYTHAWEEKALLKFRSENSNQMIFAIIQGGTFPDLREHSAKILSNLDFDGFAIGGLAIGEPKEVMYQCIDAIMPNIPENKPVYKMGLGTPEDILECIERGIDIFDSRYPTMNARHGSLFTRNGKIDIGKAIYREDFTPIENDCDCEACKNYTKAYMYHLFKREQEAGFTLRSIHNVRFIHRMLEEVRIAIKEDRFKEYKQEFLKKYLKK